MHTYVIDGQPVALQIDNAAEARYGAPATLSTIDTDITAGQAWYAQGFVVEDLFTEGEFTALRDAVHVTLQDMLSQLGRQGAGFTLETYHRFVDDAAHAALVGRTRDLFQDDLCLDVAAMHDRLGRLLGRALTDRLPDRKGRLHIIIRVNRPGSGDFNPVHKDIYEPVDHLGLIPPLVNFWIPVAGVGPLSSLPLAPGSHRLCESRILRTRAGSVVQGRRYRVNSILEWGGSRSLERARIGNGQVLVFSSHLIHGLATNMQADVTRIALEFRLLPAEGGPAG